MSKVIEENKVGKYCVLKLDTAIPIKPHTKYVIDGKDYDIVHIYDAPNCIAVTSTESFLGKTVEFK